ncbi:MAG: hypothetical protein LUD03_05820 [Firmicutes bacterium]|nr:hypothetical protein [Bacillota bacterium]
MKKMVNTRKIITAAAVIVGFALFAGAGYYIGKSAADDLQTAVPKETVTEEDMPQITQGADADRPVTYITRSKLSAVADGEWDVSDTYTGNLTQSDEDDVLTVYCAEDETDSNSQNWVAEISTADGGYYTLTSQSLTGGRLYVEIDESRGGEKSIILILTGQSGVSVKKYTYSESGFIEDVFDTQTAERVLYTSLEERE